MYSCEFEGRGWGVSPGGWGTAAGTMEALGGLLLKRMNSYSGSACKRRAGSQPWNSRKQQWFRLGERAQTEWSNMWREGCGVTEIKWDGHRNQAYTRYQELERLFYSQPSPVQKFLRELFLSWKWKRSLDKSRQNNNNKHFFFSETLSCCNPRAGWAMVAFLLVKFNY